MAILPHPRWPGCPPHSRPAEPPRRSALLLAAALLVACIRPGQAQPLPVHERPVLKILLVGNSLLYANNAPALLRALAVSQADAPAIATTSYLAPGATLSEHLRRGALARALAAGEWDALVVQERGGLLACMADAGQRDARPCRDSLSAHRRLLALARARGIRVILLGTWGPDADWQARLDAGLDAIPCNQGCERLYLGRWLRETARTLPQLQPFENDAALHPNMIGSLLIAARLYVALTARALAGRTVELRQPRLPATASIDPERPLETQFPPVPGAAPIVLSVPALAPLYQAVNAELAPPRR